MEEAAEKVAQTSQTHVLDTHMLFQSPVSQSLTDLHWFILSGVNRCCNINTYVLFDVKIIMDIELVTFTI